ncbi:protein TolA [uncultured Mediterranean phage]|nr:protein TolA [uncultured Mediterranean phage]
MFGRKKKKGTELGNLAEVKGARHWRSGDEQKWGRSPFDPLDESGKLKAGWVVAPQGTGPYYKYGTGWRAMDDEWGSTVAGALGGAAGRTAYFNPKIYEASLKKMGLVPAEDVASVKKLTGKELKQEAKARAAATVPFTQALRDRAAHGMQQRRRGHARRVELGLYGPELVHMQERVRRAANAKKQEVGGRRRAVHGRRTRRRVRRRKRRTRRHRTRRRRRSRRRRRKQRRTRHRRRKS